MAMVVSLEDRISAMKLDGGASLLTDRSTCSTTRSEYGRGDRRVAPKLTLEQEEALIGLMYDNYMNNDGKTLDYDRVVRSAVTLQCDPKVCEGIGATALKLEDAWVPDDAWITDMCFAFSNADAELTARSRPVGAITPGGISYLVAEGNADMPELPPEVLLPVSSSNTGTPGGSKKSGKKKGKHKDVSDADLLADPRAKRAASPKSGKKKPQKSPKPPKSPKV